MAKGGPPSPDWAPQVPDEYAPGDYPSLNLQMRKRQWLRDQKDRPCMDCKGEFHWSAMQFDHVRGWNYVLSGGTAYGGHGWESLRAEVALCDIVCANCHALRTYERRIAEGGNYAKIEGRKEWYEKKGKFRGAEAAKIKKAKDENSS